MFSNSDKDRKYHNMNYATKIGKYLVEKKQLKLGFCLEVALFLLTGALITKNILLAILFLIISLFVAFSVGEGIKYESIKYKEVNKNVQI
jgi:hypothetical protein